MIEFFQKIGQWFTDNIDVILAVLTPANLTAVISAIVVLVRRFKKDKSYDKTNAELTSSIKDLDGLKTTVANNNAATNKAIQTIDSLVTTVDNIREFTADNYSMLTTKIDAIMKVQTIVYSTIKDEDMRTNINNILVAAEMSDSAKILELERQIEHYKQLVTQQLEQVKADAVQEADALKENITKTTRI